MLQLKPNTANDRARARLMERQVGRCRYCERLLNMGTRELLPILDHFVPRSRGGTRRDLVLACHWCDKTKGAMHGGDFLRLIYWETVGRGLTFNQARSAINRKAKQNNRLMQQCNENGTDYSPVPDGKKQ
jgi:5-methylcytosine-specific restriction endonuclease McrA